MRHYDSINSKVSLTATSKVQVVGCQPLINRALGSNTQHSCKYSKQSSCITKLHNQLTRPPSLPLKIQPHACVHIYASRTYIHTYERTQTSNLEWLNTGNVWLDCVLYSIAPVIVHIAVPDAVNFSLGTLACGVLFSGSIPLHQKWGDQAQRRLRANGVSLFYKLRNAYETTIRFEKEVRICMYDGFCALC